MYYLRVKRVSDARINTKRISQIRYSSASTDKATLISVHVSGFHSRLRMKLSKVLQFYQITFAQEYRTPMQSTAEILPLE